jgi:pimeloyl-ACP methyl ester carboxylesterase
MSATLGKARSTLAGFERQELVLGGIRTVVHSAGEGTPLVFLHAAGTFTGFAYARGWTRTHRVIIPYHPGFGESADDARIDVIGDYALHCLELFDALGLGSLHLVGYSFGGWMAAETAILQPDRVAKLALVAPSGLVVRDPPAADLLAMHPREVPAHLMHRPERLKPFMPEGHDIDFLALRYREQTALARVAWERPSGNPKLERWLHRLRMPTLLLWGEHDRLRPLPHAERWRAALPDARLEVLPDAGHLALEESTEAAGRIAAFLGGVSKERGRGGQS